MPAVATTGIRQGDRLGPHAATSRLPASDSVGWVVVTQCCDLTADRSDEPFVQLCPAVTLSDEQLVRQANKHWLPRYVPVPGFPGEFADLARIETFFKQDVDWPAAVENEVDGSARRSFGQLVARRFGRFAFPDDFTQMFRSLRARLREKAGKTSIEGVLIDELIEVRAYPEPHWDAPSVEVALDLYFPSDLVSRRSLQADEIEDVRRRWEGRCQPLGTIAKVELAFMMTDSTSVEEYLSAFQVDLAVVS